MKTPVTDNAKCLGYWQIPCSRRDDCARFVPEIPKHLTVPIYGCLCPGPSEYFEYFRGK